MKKFVAFSMATILLLLSVFSVSATTLGDTDNDNSVGILDATQIQMYIAQKLDLSEEAKAVSDVDGDGSVSIMDCTYIQQYVAQIITEFPAEKDENPTSDGPAFDYTTDSGLGPGGPDTPEPSSATPPEESSTSIEEYTSPNEYDLAVLELVNVEREKAGLEPLKYAYFIFDCAKLRAIEADKFFSHTRPDGTPWHTVFDSLESPPDRAIAGENLAWGHETAQEVMYDEYGWMNSPGHKANILNPKFKYVAIASVECAEQRGTVCTVQLFWG